jgi:hypothetical protein
MQQIQLAAADMSRHAKLGTGIAFTLGGLVIWLAGLGMSRIASVAIGGFTGCICSCLLLTKNIESAAIGAIVGGIAGLIIEFLIAHSIGYANLKYNIILASMTSLAGTLLVFLGMIFLLFIKGARPIQQIETRYKFYASVVFAMIAFGIFEQLTFCRQKVNVPYTKKHKKLDNEVEPTGKNSWRNK